MVEAKIMALPDMILFAFSYCSCPEYSLERLMLKLKLQNFGCLMRRTDSLERPGCWERLKVGGEGDNRG